MKFISLVGSEKSGHPIANSVVPHFAGNEMISPKQVRAKLDLFLFKWFSKKGLMNCWTLLPRQIGFITWLFCQQSKKEGNEIPIKYKVYLAWRNQMQNWKKIPFISRKIVLITLQIFLIEALLPAIFEKKECKWETRKSIKCIWHEDVKFICGKYLASLTAFKINPLWEFLFVMHNRFQIILQIFLIAFVHFLKGIWHEDMVNHKM